MYKPAVGDVVRVVFDCSERDFMRANQMGEREPIRAYPEFAAMLRPDARLKIRSMGRGIVWFEPPHGKYYIRQEFLQPYTVTEQELEPYYV